MANNPFLPGPARSVQRVSAATAKNQFARVLGAAVAGSAVEITKYGDVKAVMISVEEYESLSQDPARKLNMLTERFDAMFAGMQTEDARRGMRAAFQASPEEIGQAAVEVAHRKSAAPALG